MSSLSALCPIEPGRPHCLAAEPTLEQITPCRGRQTPPQGGPVPQRPAQPGTPPTMARQPPPPRAAATDPQKGLKAEPSVTPLPTALEGQPPTCPREATAEDHGCLLSPPPAPRISRLRVRCQRPLPAPRGQARRGSWITWLPAALAGAACSGGRTRPGWWGCGRVGGAGCGGAACTVCATWRGDGGMSLGTICGKAAGYTGWAGSWAGSWATAAG